MTTDQVVISGLFGKRGSVYCKSILGSVKGPEPLYPLHWPTSLLDYQVMGKVVRHFGVREF